MAKKVNNLTVLNQVNVGFVLISESAYAALPTKDPNIFYFVYPDPEE